MLKSIHMKILKKKLLCAVLTVEVLSTGLWGCATQDKPVGYLTKSDYKKLYRMQEARNSFEATPPKDLPEMTEKEHEQLGDNYFVQNNLEMAFWQYDKALRLDPGNSRIQYKKGLVFLSRGLYPEAIQEFQDVLKKKPDHVLAHGGLGEAFFRMGQLEPAEKLFRKMLEIDQSRWKAHNFLGIIYNYLKQHEKAVSEFSMAVNLKPDEGLVYNNLGISYCFVRRYDKAVINFQRALKYTRNHNNKIYNNLGVALAQSGRYQEALEAFKKGGDEAQAYNNLGCMYLKQGEYYKAFLAFQKAIDIKPTYYEKAVENLKKAKQAYLEQMSSGLEVKTNKKNMTISETP